MRPLHLGQTAGHPTPGQEGGAPLHFVPWWLGWVMVVISPQCVGVFGQHACMNEHE